MNDVEGSWPEAGLERVPHCPVCGGDSRTLVHEGLRDRVFFCAPGEWALHRCKSCGSGYLDPRPTIQTVGLAYKRYYTHSNNERNGEQLSLFRRLRLALANGYHNARVGTVRRPQLLIGAWLAKILPGQRAVLDAEARHLARPEHGLTLLDVGCGDGRFLQFAAEMGWTVEGVEVDSQAVEVARARGLTVHQGSLESLSNREGTYDVITLNHVIEHVHDARGLLRGCFRLLRPGGRIWLETPNMEAAGHRRYGPDWRDLDPPRHLVLFTWGSLGSVLKEVGFKGEVPLPGRPMASITFPGSEAIRQGRDPCVQPNKSLRVRWCSWRADRKPMLNEREFITMSARKPSTNEIG